MNGKRVRVQKGETDGEQSRNSEGFRSIDRENRVLHVMCFTYCASRGILQEIINLNEGMVPIRLIMDSNCSLKCSFQTQIEDGIQGIP